MKKIFTLFAALMMAFSMSAATKTIYCKMAQSWWKADGAAVGAYYWGTGSGPAWPGVRMTPVSGETDLWSIDIDTDKFQNIIFTRVNGSGTVSDWGAKTADLTVPTDDKNLYTITSTSPVWGSPGVAGNWSVYAPDAPKTYKDITITIVANATPKIHYWEGGDKVVGTEWDAKPEMVATGEENTYSYTIKEVDEATGVKYLVVVGDVQSADQQTFENVTVNFKELLPQVVVKGINGDWGDTNKMTVADDYLSASITLALEATKDYELKLTINGEWFGSKAITITKDNNSASFAENGDGNGKLTTDLAGDYVFTYTYATKTLVVTYPEPVIPCTQATAINWDDAINAEANSDKWYAVNVVTAKEAGKDLALTVTNPGNEAVEITVEAYTNCPATDKLVSATKTLNAGETKTTTVKFDEYLADQVDVVYLHVVSSGDLTVGAEAIEPEPEYELMELTMTNLQVSDYGNATGLWASDMDNGIEVMLFLDAEGNLMEESSIMVGWMDYTVTGTVTKAYNEELATDVYTAELYTTVGETNYKLIITMYYVPAEATPVVVENATIDDQTEETGFMYMTGVWTDAEGVVYPVSAEVPGFDATVAEAVYKNVTVTVGGWGDEDPWLGFVQGDATITIAENVVTLTGVMSSWDGLTLDVTITGTLPVVEPEKPEPTYTDNSLNPYAFGLESKLSADQSVLNVTYRLNNSKATDVDVVVYNGTEVVKVVAGTTNLGKNTVEIPTAGLPGGVELTWAVIVNGTSVDAPTREEKIYSFYHPSGLDIDNNPENKTFGMLLVNEGMQSVASKTEGYVSAGFGAGIFAFTPSFDLIPNGELPGYNGGNEFTNNRADDPTNSKATAYAPRRIRISEDGRIFVTSLNTDGNYLWEVNPDNMNEWTTIFKGTLNDQRELVDAEGNFVAAPNNGFDVKGSGENLQLAMYSVNLSGITAAVMSGFRLHEYNLGTATEWATAPSKALVEGKYAINYSGTQVEYDNEGGLWICSYRGSATDANPGLVHINAEGVEDAKLVWNNVRNAGIRFNNDFTKLVVAGNNGAAKKATIYAVSKDANGAPVLTEETVVDMAVVGNNLNDFAWDYAGNLYSCGNSSEKLAAWAMPYSGEVETPAAAKYAFVLEGTGSDYEMYEDVITNLVIDYDNMLLIGGPSEAFQVEVVLGLGDYDRNTDAFQLLPASTISVLGSEATFIDGVASVDGIDQTATAIVHCMWNGMALEFHLTMTAAPLEATKVVVENAAIEIEKVLLWGDMYDYTLKMTGVWTNEGVDYPVLVEVPVYYPEATEPYEMYSTVTVGGWGDEDPWLGFGEGYLTITQEGQKITAAGVVENPMAGIAIDITISGNLNQGPGTGLENATVTIKSVKMIKNGQLIIEKDGVQYNAQGAIVK